MWVAIKKCNVVRRDWRPESQRCSNGIVQRWLTGLLLRRVAALVTCAPDRVWLSVINGQILVEDYELRTLDLGPLVERHNQISRGMLERASLPTYC